MKKTSWTWVVSGVALAVLVVASASSSCAKKPKLARTGDVTQSAIATYVAPGDLDQYYLFYSGGHSGNVLRGRRALHASYRHHTGVYTLSRYWLRLRQGVQGDAG
ncbi:MAG TPA: hypothetical protein VI424_10610 [Terriglobales bacterium]